MRRWMQLLSLMFAGESIYLLPYLRKTFQTSMESAFELTAAELGQLNTTFGVVALLCYLPGGWLSDRFSPRSLMVGSLVATALGAFVLMMRPGHTTLLALHAYWGAASILAFWPALIRATRQWGRASQQGLGFGLLDGGRGLVAALLATLATYLFALGGSVEARLDRVLWVYGLAPLVAALWLWRTLDDANGRAPRTAEPSSPGPEGDLKHRVRTVVRMPEAWLLSGVVFSAYWLYVGSFELPAYAERVHGQSKTFGAVLGTVRDWIRPVAAVGAGLLADRFRGSRIVRLSFAALALTCASLAWARPSVDGALVRLWLQVGAMATCVFALRGVYFTLLEESDIPRHLTGTTVGFVSAVGFLPDIFAFLLSGWLVTRSTEAAGYRHYFAVLSGVAAFGLLASSLLSRRNRRR